MPKGTGKNIQKWAQITTRF